MEFKKIAYLLGLLGVLSTLPAQAIFVAYQEWENPKTGQILEEYYDAHLGGSAINQQHKMEFVIDAKRYGKNCLVIAEDALHGVLPNDLKDFDILVISPSPLTHLGKACKEQVIPFYNCDIRDCVTLKRSDDSKHLLNDDGPVLNSYYKSLHKLNQLGLKEFCRMPSARKALMTLVYGSSIGLQSLLLETRILHTIHTTPHGRIKLGAGLTHIVGINPLLYQLGWRPKKTVMHSDLMKISRLYKPISTYLFDYTMQPEKALRLYEKFSRTYQNTLMEHPLDLNKVHGQSATHAQKASPLLVQISSKL